MTSPIIDLVIPCYRVSKQVVPVLQEALALSFVRNIIVVDDACPEGSGQIVRAAFAEEKRVVVLQNETNLGVGGAVLHGYQYAFENHADIAVKVDGDGQMPPGMIATLIKPILQKRADYTKGNRFYHPAHLAAMPKARIFGNAVLSLVNKFSSGYWSIIDPTNGFTALHRTAYHQLITATLDRRYFFESDMLFQLGTINAVVKDVSMPAVYRGEPSSLNIYRIAFEFPPKYLARLIKRIGFRYFVREFNIASLEMALGIPSFLIGLGYGLYAWAEHAQLGEATPAGTSMIVGLFMLMGFQMILSALNYDITHEPRDPLILID